MLVFCQGTYEERMDQTKECIRRIRPYIDRVVIIGDETISQESKDWLKENECELYIYPWNDNFPEMRNHYLHKCQMDDWVIVSDPDEWFCEEFCTRVRELCDTAEKAGAASMLINSHDSWHKYGEEEITVINSSFHKKLIFRKYRGVRYLGCGKSKTVHENLVMPGHFKEITLDGVFYYEHHKFEHEVWERAMRNVYCGGGGDNVGDVNTQWMRLLNITRELGLNNWKDVRAYMRRGNIDDSLKQWLLDNRVEGFDYQHEMMEGFRWYFEHLHPEENTGNWKPTEYTEEDIGNLIRHTYLKFLGREPDEEGFKTYFALLESKTISRKEFLKIITDSEEYKHRFTTVQISDSSLVRKWNKLLRIPMKAETRGIGTDETSIIVAQSKVSVFKQHCDWKNFQRVLNLGAGCGEETFILQQDGYDPIGITFGKDNINVAAERYGVKLLEMDMHDLDFKDEYFDAIFASQTFEHAFSPWLLIIEMRRVLRNGGRVYIDVPDPDNPETLAIIWHTSALYKNQIRSLFEKAGFKEIVNDGYMFIFEKIPDGEFHMWNYVQYIMRD